MAVHRAASTDRDTFGRLAVTRGGGWVKRCTRIASTVAPVNGASPASISYRTLASE